MLLQNHSCNPNSGIVAAYIDETDIQKPLLALFTLRKVKSGEEITFDYAGNPDEDEDRAQKVSSV